MSALPPMQVAVCVVRGEVAYGVQTAPEVSVLCHAAEGGVAVNSPVGCGEYVEWLCDHCDETNARICASYTPRVKVKDEVKAILEAERDKQLKLFDL